MPEEPSKQLSTPDQLAELAIKVLKPGGVEVDGACWQETQRTPEHAIEASFQALEPALQTARYATLKDLLKTQQWREADKETYRLMITTVGKNPRQWFDRDDLENFPCEDLRSLDQLWVHYSHGKWGFSVQKHIWQECGSPITYNNDWDTFCDRVGWRKDGDWVDYSHFTFDLKNAQIGKFPALGLWWDVFVRRCFARLVQLGESNFGLCISLLSHKDL